jgi:hypothetical protein
MNTQLLAGNEFEEECIDKCKMFLWNVARSPEQCAAKSVKKYSYKRLNKQGKWL